MALEWTEIGGLIAVSGGAIGGLFKGWQTLNSDKFRHKQEAGESLLTGYQKLIDGLRGELERVRETCRSEIAALKLEHKTDRAEWEADRAEMQTEIGLLRACLTKLELELRPPHGTPGTS